MICKNCGYQLPDTAAFCTNCGCAVDVQPQPQPPQPQYQQPVYQQPMPQQPVQPQYRQPMYQQPYQAAPMPQRRPSATALVMAIFALVFSLLSVILLSTTYDRVTSARIFSTSASGLAGMIVLSVIFAILGLIFGIIGTVKGATVTRIVKPRPASHTVAMVFGIISIVASSGMLIFFIAAIETLDRYL